MKILVINSCIALLRAVCRVREIQYISGVILCGHLAGCNPGVIKLDEYSAVSVSGSLAGEQLKVYDRVAIDQVYLAINAMYVEPGSAQLPGNLKRISGIGLKDLCSSGFKISSDQLSSVVSFKIGENGSTDEESIPVFGFSLARSGNDCEITGERKQVVVDYPFNKYLVDINYGLRSSSGAELPFEEIHEAVKTLSPVISPGTVVYKIATDAVLKDIGRAANSKLEANIKSSFNGSSTISMRPKSSLEEYYIPMRLHKDEEVKLVGYIRVQVSIVASVFTESTMDGYPDYRKAVLKNYHAQGSGSTESISQYVAERRDQIMSGGADIGVDALNASCSQISEELREEFAFAKPDRAFLLSRILRAHPLYNKPLPRGVVSDSEMLERIRVMEAFTNLQCLSEYRDVMDEPAYGLNNMRGEYVNEMLRLGEKIISTQELYRRSEILLNDLASAFKKVDKSDAVSLIENIVFSNRKDVRVENLVDDKVLTSSGVAGSSNLYVKQAAKILGERLNPGRLGCYIGMSGEDVRSKLQARGYDAYALYKSEDPTVGDHGWLRIFIAQNIPASSEGDSLVRPSVYKISLMRVSKEEPEYLNQLSGVGAGSSALCQNLLKDFLQTAL